MGLGANQYGRNGHDFVVSRVPTSSVQFNLSAIQHGGNSVWAQSEVNEIPCELDPVGQFSYGFNTVGHLPNERKFIRV